LIPFLRTGSNSCSKQIYKHPTDYDLSKGTPIFFILSNFSVEGTAYPPLVDTKSTIFLEEDALLTLLDDVDEDCRW
jgi:hypothetical protein